MSLTLLHHTKHGHAFDTVDTEITMANTRTTAHILWDDLDIGAAEYRALDYIRAGGI